MLNGMRNYRLNTALLSITVANIPWAYRSPGHGGNDVSHTRAGSIQGAQRYP